MSSVSMLDTRTLPCLFDRPAVIESEIAILSVRPVVPVAISLTEP